ncbi:MAG: cytochrome b N-terminal domain-containing protein [Desulfobacterales bacterium]
MKSTLKDILFQNLIWKSIVRNEIRPSEWLKTKTLGLGLINVFLFVILTLTGILLMFYYVPDTGKAYQSMKDLEYVISFGMIIRNMHRWAAYLMIISVFLHFSRVFYMAEYRNPRQFNWVIGLMMLLCVLIMGNTGYLLPWDQKSYWGMTILSNVISSIPVIGGKLKYLVLGGTEVGQNILTRAFDMHVKVLPLVLGFLMGIHFWRIRKDDILAGSFLPENPTAPAAENRSGSDDPQGQNDIGWSDIITRESSKCLLILAIVMGISLLLNAPLEEVATPSVTPNPAKAPWFFLDLQELISWGPPFWFGIVVPSVVVLFLMLVPYLDRGQTGTGQWFHPSRRIQNILFTAFVTIVIGLIIIGKFMRGPGWVFYWPWQSWPTP